jgi:hypothetical protein
MNTVLFFVSISGLVRLGIEVRRRYTASKAAEDHLRDIRDLGALKNLRRLEEMHRHAEEIALQLTTWASTASYESTLHRLKPPTSPSTLPRPRPWSTSVPRERVRR